MCDETPLYDEIPDYRHRLIDYVGNGFLIGAASGSVFHFVRGLLNSPGGGRLAGGARAALANAPRVAGSAGAFLAVFGTVETAASLARRREDYWNFIAAGAASSGLFAMRRGAPATAGFALLGATMFAGAAGLYWTTEFLQSYIRSSSEARNNRGLPAPVVITPPHGVPAGEEGGSRKLSSNIKLSAIRAGSWFSAPHCLLLLILHAKSS